MLGELEANGRTVVFDMEAGLGTLLRLEAGDADVVLVMADPSAKSIEFARRASTIAASRARVVVIANKVRDAADLDAVAVAVPGHDVRAVPYDDLIVEADVEGTAPIDRGGESPGTQAIVELADELVRSRR